MLVEGVASLATPSAAFVMPTASSRPYAMAFRGAFQPFVAISRPHVLNGAPLIVRAKSHSRRIGSLDVAVKASSNGASSNGAAGDNSPIENVVIIGSGPAGYTAAIYAARANLRPILFMGQASGVPGGQLMTTTEVENFPGFPQGITGPDLMDRMQQQAERWGSRLLTEDVEDIDLTQRPFVIRGTGTTALAHSIIVATGATAKRLGIPSESRFWSAGISACAICDGASPIFKNQEVAVVGGGDTATEEAVYLTKYASHVHLLVRGPKLRASAAMADRAQAHPKVTVHFNTAVEDAFAENDGAAMTGLHLIDTVTGERRDLAVRGLFYGIGHKPNTAILRGQVALDDAGYIAVQHGAQTSVEGVFSAGDVHDTEWRQAITAAGSGCMAALSAERYLTANDLVVEAPAGNITTSAAAAADEQPAASSSGNQQQDSSSSLESEFDIHADKHRGQFALRKLYHESDRVIVVLYTAPTCGPCRALKPIMNKVVDDYPGKVHYVEIDIEANPEIAQAAGVSGTPTVHMFKNKEMVANLPGVKMKREYKELIEQELGIKAEVMAK